MTDMGQFKQDIVLLSRAALKPAPVEYRRDRLADMNEEIDRLEREGRDLEALNLAERANALARSISRQIAAERAA